MIHSYDYLPKKCIRVAEIHPGQFDDPLTIIWGTNSGGLIHTYTHSLGHPYLYAVAEFA
jgi:hypothetical protein